MPVFPFKEVFVTTFLMFVPSAKLTSEFPATTAMQVLFGLFEASIVAFKYTFSNFVFTVLHPLIEPIIPPIPSFVLGYDLLVIDPEICELITCKLPTELLIVPAIIPAEPVSLVILMFAFKITAFLIIKLSTRPKSPACS